MKPWLYHRITFEETKCACIHFKRKYKQSTSPLLQRAPHPWGPLLVLAGAIDTGSLDLPPGSKMEGRKVNRGSRDSNIPT